MMARVVSRRFTDLEQVADFVAEWIDDLGFYADDFDCGAIAMAIATQEDDDPDGHWLINTDEPEFREIAAWYQVE